MAGCGHDAENGKLDDTARARWRQQARDWLTADLALRRKQLESEKEEERKAVLYALNHMRTHDHLASIRNTNLLRKLPADEQAACLKLWADVETLSDKARGPSK